LGEVVGILNIHLCSGRGGCILEILSSGWVFFRFGCFLFFFMGWVLCNCVIGEDGLESSFSFLREFLPFVTVGDVLFAEVDGVLLFRGGLVVCLVEGVCVSEDFSDWVMFFLFLK